MLFYKENLLKGFFTRYKNCKSLFVDSIVLKQMGIIFLIPHSSLDLTKILFKFYCFVTEMNYFVFCSQGCLTVE